MGQVADWIADHLDPVVAASSLRLDVDPNLREQVGHLARGRPLIIDYYAVPLRGIRVGDMTARFASRPLEPRYVELRPVDGVRVLAHHLLLELLTDGGATLRLSGIGPFRHVAVTLPRPERWIDFLERCPARRTGGVQ